MAEDTGGIARLNYFNSQLLDESDFKVEQNYHMDMRRRHNRFVHTVGVAGAGLQVTKDGDKRVKVSAGMAIDSLGREIVFAADRTIDIDAVRAKANATVFLTVAHVEEKELRVQDVGGSAVNHRRMGEHTAINFLDRKPPDDGAVITLAAIRLDGGGNIAEIDNGVRTLVGSVIDPRSDLTVRRLTVAGEQKIGANLDVGANLSVVGNTDLRGSVTARSLAVTTSANVTGGLTVAGTSELRASVKVGVDLTVASALKVDGETSLAALTVAGRSSFLGQVGIGTGTVSPGAGLEINKGPSNDIALILASTGPGFGSGMHLHNRAPNGHLYYMYSDVNGLFVMGDGTPGRDKVLWVVNAGGEMNVQAPLRASAGVTLTSGLNIDRGGANEFGMTIRSSQDFGTGLQLQNTAAGGHRYSIYSRADGGLTIGDETRGARVIDVDKSGGVSGAFKSASSRSLKKNLTALSDGDYADVLEKISATSIFRYQYQNENEHQHLHLGVIAEDAPDEIVDSEKRHVVVLDYLGFLFAGIKAQAQEIDKLKARLTPG